LSLLRGKVAILEEELSKSRQESTEYRQLSDRLAKVWSYSMHTLM
jgi:tousled-like kinase